MSKTRVPAIPAPTDANLREVARAVKSLLDVREGLLGDPLDANVTFRDLQTAGVIQTTAVGGSGGLIVSPGAAGGGTSSGYDPSKDLNPPPAPAGLAASGAISSVILTWGPIPVSYPNHAFTEVWRADENVIGNAIMVGTTSATVYVDSLDPGQTRFYWIRHWSQADVAGPYNAADGVSATTGQDPSAMVAAMTGEGKPFTVLTEPTVIGGVTFPAGIYSTLAFIQDLQVTNAKISDLAVDNAKIADLSVAKLTGAEMKVGAFIQSVGFSSGPNGSGFRLDADGNAELNNATVRGSVFASDGQFFGEVIALAPNGNKARMWSGDFEIYKQVPSVGSVLYKALSRVEHGVGANNVQVTIPGYFLNQPRVIVSPANIKLYDSAYANQSQALQCEAQYITESSAGSMVWSFKPVATLTLAANTGQTVLNQSSGQISSNWTSSQYTTAANTTTITPSVGLASYRGTGTSGGYYRRTARWRVQYLSGSTWVDGTWTTVDLPSSVNASATSTENFTFPSAGAWVFRIQFEAYDTGGTFATTVEYEYATDTATRSDTQTITAQVAFSSANTLSSSINYTPSYALPAGWTLTGVAFTYSYSYNVTASNSLQTSARVEQTGGSMWHQAPPNSSGNNLTASRNTSTNSLNFYVSATRTFSSQSASAVLTLNSITGVYSRRKPLTNSATEINSFSLDSYTYQLAAAQTLAAGTLNWIAIGE